MLTVTIDKLTKEILKKCLCIENLYFCCRFIFTKNHQTDFLWFCIRYIYCSLLQSGRSEANTKITEVIQVHSCFYNTTNTGVFEEKTYRQFMFCINPLIITLLKTFHYSLWNYCIYLKHITEIKCWVWIWIKTLYLNVKIYSLYTSITLLIS